MGSIKGKTIVITGGGSGIGRAIAKRFAADGALVVATDINDQGLAALEGIEGILTTHADVSSWEQVRASVQFAVDRTGKLDVYVNCAGIALNTLLVDTDPAKFALLQSIHVNGCFYGMKASLEHMRPRGSGNILNVISRVAETGTPNTSAYGAAKAAMWVLNRVAAAENKDAGICINALFPGMSLTGMTKDGALGDPSHLGAPDQEYDTFKMLATLDPGGDTGAVWSRGRVYPMFEGNDLSDLTGDLAAGRRGREK